MKPAVSLPHSWLARDGPLGAFAAGCCWPQPTRPTHITPDNAAPTFSDFHMVTPPLLVLRLDTQNLSPVALDQREQLKGIGAPAFQRPLVGAARVDAVEQSHKAGRVGFQPCARSRRLQWKTHLHIRRAEF